MHFALNRAGVSVGRVCPETVVSRISLLTIGVLVTVLAVGGCAGQEELETGKEREMADKNDQLETATFGTGCFWCTEAVFQQVKGVEAVQSGYTGGSQPNPTYEQICSGTTGHAEVIQIKFDPRQVSYQKLLEVFWKSHDPTTLNRQGNDVGTQYRSAIFYENEAQKELAEQSRARLTEAKAFPRPIVTEITPLAQFYPAEDYHQNYFNLNGRQPYCSAIIRPKVEKIRQIFAEDLKD